MIRVQARIEGADRTSKEFAEARRDIYRRTRSGLKKAGEKAILPKAQRATGAKTPIQSTQLVVKTTASSGYLTCKTKKAGRVVGLLNYGGAVRAPIEPRKAQAVAFNGVVVARVNTPRKYRATHFLEDARDAGFPLFSQILLEELMEAFDPLDHTP